MLVSAHKIHALNRFNMDLLYDNTTKLQNAFDFSYMTQWQTMLTWGYSSFNSYTINEPSPDPVPPPKL